MINALCTKFDLKHVQKAERLVGKTKATSHKNMQLVAKAPLKAIRALGAKYYSALADSPADAASALSASLLISGKSSHLPTNFL